MSSFFSGRFAALTPYVPGEQPRDQQYVKLNTNENPYPPTDAALQWAAEHTRSLNLYSDPDCTELREELGALLDVRPEQIVVTNGSDEILNFAFMAFCDEDCPAVFPNITYGFYPVFAAVNRLPYTEIPLKADFTVDVDACCRAKGTLFLANPNAPTGIFLELSEIERIAASDPKRVVVVDEAYVDFGGESAISLIPDYPNLLVTRTFSKSRSMAGARLGFGVGNEALIADINTIRYSINPYNVNSMTLALGVGVLKDEAATQARCREIMAVRSETAAALEARGFTVLPSCANFVFAASPKIGGEALYRALKERGVLVRHFSRPEIVGYNRITIGTREQMTVFFRVLDEILGGIQ